MEIGTSEWKDVISRGADAFDIAIGDASLNALAVHAAELLQWNRSANLTAITDPFEIAVKHMVDSIVPLRFMPAEASVLDVGTGGGFPGIVLKILRPALHLTLIDASRKKTHFLKNVIRRLGLSDTHVQHCRIEEMVVRQSSSEKPQGMESASDRLSDTIIRPPYDVVISRAAFSLGDFVRKAMVAVKPTGQIIALKGPVSQHEVDAFCIDGTDNDSFKCRIYRFNLPFTDARRSIVDIRLSADVDLHPRDRV